MTTTSMTAISKNNTHNVNAGGRFFCRVCGFTSNNYASVYGHVAIRHIGAWTRTMYNIICSR